MSARAWQSDMRMRNGERGYHFGVCEITGRHRVFVGKNMGQADQIGTTWLSDDEGFSRRDRKPDIRDVVGVWK